MAENNSFKSWISFWKSIDYGPKGSLIGLVVSTLILLGPTILKFLLYLVIIGLCMALGGLVGALIGWIIESSKGKK